MSVESEILRIQHNIADAYTKVLEKGGEVPLRPDSANLAEAVASIPFSVELIAGDGLSKEDDILSVDNPVRGIYTQSEFDALTEAQKASGTYFVDDGSSCSEWEEYSTEEQMAGRWIDGRPIYRRTFVVEFTNGSSKLKIISLAGLGIEEILSFDGVVDTPQYTTALNSYEASNTYTGMYLAKRTSDLVFYGYNVYESGTLIVTLKYTKTTDQEVSA